MLVPAIKYKEELNSKFQDTVLDPYYKFFHMSYPETELLIHDSFWDMVQLVSLNDKNEVIGYLSANIKRPESIISSISAMNFNRKEKMCFGKDLFKFVDSLLNVYNFLKIKFFVVCGNPVEKTYDKLISKYNGRVVGVFKNDVLLQDNKFYDVKYYEILKGEIWWILELMIKYAIIGLVMVL